MPKQAFSNIDTTISIKCITNITQDDQIKLNKEKNLQHELIRWFKENREIQLDPDKYSLLINNQETNILVSELQIFKATYSDSATYSCKYKNTNEHSTITVLNESMNFQEIIIREMPKLYNNLLYL